MKADLEVKKKMMANIHSQMDSLFKSLYSGVMDSINAKYVDELMTAKRKMMENIVRLMPLYGEHCYFCLKKPGRGHEGCKTDCEYAILHGLCDDDSSDWKKIRDARKDLRVAQEAYHPDGMKYRSFLIKRTRVDCNVLHGEYIPTLTKWRDDFVGTTTDALAKMDKAETVEDLMDAKKWLLYYMISKLPTEGSVCYFCRLHGTCKFCQYGHKHKNCNKSGSDYKVMRAAEADLRNLIKRYYRYEKYGPDDPLAPPCESPEEEESLAESSRNIHAWYGSVEE